MNRHRGSVFRLAYSYLRNRADADDVVQEVFLKLYRHGDAILDDEHAAYWLLRVTVNECTSLYRALRRRPEDIEDYIETLAAPDRAEPTDSQDSRLIRRLMGLPTRYRVPLYLYYFEGRSMHEVAELLGAPDATVRTRLARGRAKLRDVLEEGGLQ